MRRSLAHVAIDVWAAVKEYVRWLLLMVWAIVIGIAALVMLIDWVMGW